MNYKLVVFCTLYAAVAAVLPSLGIAQGAMAPSSNSRLMDIERYRLQLEDLASEFGPMDNSLLEPLTSMLSALLEEGEFQQAAEIQNRQMSIMRTNLGFENPDLIPLLRGMIQVQQVLGNWPLINDHLEHIRVLISSNYGSQSEELLLAMENHAQWLLARFYLDDERKQSQNFLDARDLYRDMQQLSEDIYGEDSPKLYPWYYKRAHNLALMFQLLNTRDGFAIEFTSDVIRADTSFRVQDVDFMTNRGNAGFILPQRNYTRGKGYLRQARGFINDIREIAEIEGDEEAQAMALIYRGDYNVLLGRNSGRQHYNEAKEKLAGLGIPLSDIEEFFRTPMPLPVPQFHENFDELLMYQRSINSAVHDVPNDVMHLGIFSAWHENASAVLKPVSSDPLLQIGMPQYLVDLSFNISSRGDVSSVKVINSVPEDRRVAREGLRAIREIKFRPAIEGKRAVRTRDVQMRYLFAQEL